MPSYFTVFTVHSKNMLVYPQENIFDSHEEKKYGMTNYSFKAIPFYGNMARENCSRAESLRVLTIF